MELEAETNTTIFLSHHVQVKHMLSSSAESHNYMENTHIAYLCDLLERIWGHGLKKREVNLTLYLWSGYHLVKLPHNCRSPPLSLYSVLQDYRLTAYSGQILTAKSQNWPGKACA